MKRKIFLISLLLAQMLIMTSCASTKLINPWRDTGYQGPVKKVFVVGVVKDRGRRSLIENEFVRQFKARGMEAVASTEVLSDEGLPTRETVEPKVREQGADAVLVAKFIKRETKDTYTPRHDSGVPMNFTADINAMFQFPEKKEREMTYGYDFAVMQLTLYNTETNKPIWSSLTETKYQGGGTEQIKPFVSFVVMKLTEEKLIK